MTFILLTTLFGWIIFCFWLTDKINNQFLAVFVFLTLIFTLPACAIDYVNNHQGEFIHAKQQ